ncbi:hypothetical protein [Symbiobacterium terraclitae]|uniref:hypothetical protein n=1 Tax=Symbiobacterium terraclitae TaxID=557451 RepID=UPI0035B51840
MDLKQLYGSLHRDPEDYPLFAQIWQVLTFAPSCRHADEEELVSLAADAFDYLQTNGEWQMTSATGTTKLRWDGTNLAVEEDDGRDYYYQNTFVVGEA